MELLVIFSTYLGDSRNVCLPRRRFLRNRNRLGRRKCRMIGSLDHYMCFMKHSLFAGMVLVKWIVLPELIILCVNPLDTCLDYRVAAREAMRRVSLLSWPARTPPSVAAKSTPSTITIPGYKDLLLIISDLLPRSNHSLICSHSYGSDPQKFAPTEVGNPRPCRATIGCQSAGSSVGVA